MTRGIILALLAAFSWGSAIVMSKISLDELGAGSLFFFQVCAATVLSWLMLIGTGKKLTVSRTSLLAYSTGLFEPFLAYILTLYGLKHVQAGIASVIFSLESAFILILSVIIFRMRIRSPWIFLLLLIVAMAGSLMVVLPDAGEKDGNIMGYFLVLAGVISAAFYVVISSKLVDVFDPVNLLTGQLTFSFIMSSIFLIVSGEPVSLPEHSILLVILSGVLQYFLAFLFYLHALKWTEVHIAGVMLYFIPVIAVILSYFFLGEKLSFIQVSGIILTIISVYILNRKYDSEH
ncbi:TPA: DMT family transporter [Salmonella enterica]|uniref:Threonine/homoserine exporter RhtA n=1 Tax=Salmonella enterica TaxID=28901 RepID=A0A754B8S6_SALER|nr:DMT family transporter [Salmonella enterica]ECU9164084.1 DMT family transporter [Salmonella enterica subsp. enterica serovar Newport str. CFSAN000599]EDU1197020.1 DMT family transporter [Salmonella enterica subsp. enterica serovar Heidelberg str. CFSAN000576]HAF8581149.1 DMT family transporter [Salmonella enterica]